MKVLHVFLCIAVVYLQYAAAQSTDETTEGPTHMPDMPGMDHGSMKMYFHHTSHATILFKGWHTMEYWHLFLSCLAVIVMAALYEGYKTMRESIQRKMAPRTVLPMYHGGSTNKTVPSSTEQLQVEETAAVSPASVGWFSASLLCDCGHVAQSFLHVGQVFISYCLMLIFMTYNIWLCLAVCIGAGLGYWLFGMSRTLTKEANEHCH